MIANDFAIPRFAEKVLLPSDWHASLHSHPQAEFVVVFRGCLRIDIQGSTLIAPGGSVAFIPKGVAHEEWAHAGPNLQDWPSEPEYLELIRIGFSLHSHLGAATMAPLVFDKDGAMLPLAQLYHRERINPIINSDLRIALFSSLFLERRRLSGITEPPLVISVREYIRSHLSESISLIDLARIAGMSKFHFTRVYRDLTGFSPMADARRIRLEEARYLIHDKGLLMKEVAPMLGFANERHLARMLKQSFGVGTKKLRNMGRE